jgi:ion channel
VARTVAEPDEDVIPAALGRRAGLRSRVARLRATHSYRTVLALIAATFVFASVAPDDTWTVAVLLLLQSGMLLTAVWTSGLARADSKPLIAVLVTATVLAGSLLVWHRAGLLGAAGIVSGVLALATVVVIAIGVIDQDDVNVQSITGAVCIYLLFGILFLFLYNALALLGSGDFFAQGTDGTRSTRVYFSYVTLATLGYGDYTPATGLGHTLAVLEALLGQLYLVTVLALLVSRMRGAGRLSARKTGDSVPQESGGDGKQDDGGDRPHV